MVSLHPQYIVDDTQTQQAVIINIKEWENIMEKLEMLDDIEAYDKAKQQEDTIIPFEQAVKEIRDNNFEI
jgi:PHD/YefM family antitoxin component YafN of YafNO toxin-antitoxin module